MTACRVSALLAVLLLPLAACHKEEVTSYQIPKEKDPELPLAGAAADTSTNGGSESMPAAGVQPAQGPALAWTAPAAWKAKALDSVRLGSYDVPGPDGQTADFSVIAFPGDVGGELANVNRWRGQVQLPPVDDSGLAAVVDREQENGLAATVVDCGVPGGQRILGAIVPFNGNTWFFKMIGPDALVEGAKPCFLQLLRTLRPAAAAIGAAPAMPPAGGPAGMAGMAVPVAQGSGLAWTAPGAWRSEAPGPMRKATYAVPGTGGEAADFSITAFPGDVGGELANVNRWRGQVQLPPVDDSGLAAVVDREQENGLAATVVDCGVPGGQRILGAIVPFNGNTWFFKMIGPDALVEGAKPGFLQLLRTLRPAARP